MNANITTDPNKMILIAQQTGDLVHEAHDALDRMDTALTLAEAKVALVRHMILRRQMREFNQRCDV